MMIWKYEISVTAEQVLHVPKGATPLSVQVQEGAICIWFFVDEKNEKVATTVHVVGAGYNPSKVKLSDFVGTVQTPPFVWHVFVERN